MPVLILLPQQLLSAKSRHLHGSPFPTIYPLLTESKDVWVHR